ncbi:MAG: GEVED domain-containing protein [Bacteroidota bacterium]
MNSRPCYRALLAAFLAFFIWQNTNACGYSYVSDCATTLNIEANGNISGFQVSECPYLTVFNNHNFGNVTSLTITQAQSVTWESCNNEVKNALFYYRIYEQTTAPGSFSTIELPQVNIVTFGSYRTRYREQQTNLNLLAGLAAGQYFIEVYFASEVGFDQGSSSVDDVITKNNSGQYYRASFTVGNSQGGSLGLLISNQLNASCNGNANGSALVSVTNGTPPISYLWSNGTIGPFIENVSAGTYGVTATDANNETGALSVIISQPTSLQVNLSSIAESSASASDGSASVQAFGGTPPYVYLWSTGSTAATINDLEAGSYSVSVSDANGCLSMGTVLVTITGNDPTNYCPAEGEFPWVDWITGFSLNTIAQESGKSQYSDFTTNSTDLNVGGSYPVAIENSYSWQTYDEYIKVWIDYNRNGSFEEPDEIAFQTSIPAPPLGTESSISNGTINVPATADEGATRMRIALKRGAYPTPCEIIPFGEVEDYSINLTSGGAMPCNLTASITDISCQNNGTATDPSDDTFDFQLSVTGNNASANWTAMINGTQYTNPYGNKISIGGIPINGSNLIFTIIDEVDSACSVIQNVTPPAPCSNTTPCSISADMSTPICQNNGTPDDPVDDSYTFNLTVTGNNTGGNWNTNVLGQLQSGSYGVTTQMGPYPIAQGSQVITISDESDNACLTDLTINPPATCSAGTNGNDYCSSTSGFPWHDWISGVLFEQIDNGSGKTAFSDFTNQSANVAAGNSYPIAMTCGFSWYTYDEHWMVWIDYNQDGTFQEPDEIALSIFEPAPPNGTDNHTIFGNIDIPGTALSGPTRMRISLKRSSAAAPCETLPFGEVEDYTINIVNNLNGGGSFLIVDLEGTPDIEHVDLYAMVNTDVPGSWTLEKSTNILDFELMENGNAAGGQMTVLHVQDDEPADGQNHYRISLFDENGHLLSRTYTTIPFEHVATFGLFPNPARQQVSIRLSELLGQEVRIEIFNQIGQPVYQKMVGKVIDPIHSFDIDHWRDGLYQVIVFPEGKRMVSRQLAVLK